MRSAVLKHADHKQLTEKPKQENKGVMMCDDECVGKYLKNKVKWDQLPLVA